MSEADDELWTALDQANRDRARLYVEFMRAIEERFVRAAAVEVCKRAVRQWGRGLGAGLKRHRPADFQGLARSFAFAPDGGRMFGPRVDRCDGEGLVVAFERCPLQAAWREAGLDDGDIELLCAIACQADYGTLEEAGFTVDIETWKRGRNGCCRVSIRRREAP